MKRIIVLILVLLLSNCKSQTNNINNNMKYFNEKEFRGWKKDESFINSEDDIYLKKDNNRVRIIKDEKEITVERTYTDSPYKKVEIYYPNQNIKYWGDEFYSFPIGIWFCYDEIGRKIKEENLDIDYKFSVKDLIQKFQKEYNIDIEDPRKVFKCNRYNTKDSIPIYEIGIKTNEPYKWDFYIIDGNSGVTLYNTTIRRGDWISPIEEYEKLRKENKQQKNTSSHTFNGKTYTEEEWKAFEQEQWEKYQAKRSKKGFLNWLFG